MLCAIIVPLPVAAQTATQGAGATISVDVDWVVLPVTVCNRRGGFVSGLTVGDFRVFEDGQRQDVRLFRHEDSPVSVGLAVDNSTSMGRKRGDVTTAALAFVRSSNPQDEMFVVNFNERVTLGLPPTELFSASSAELEKSLNGVPAYGRTALYDAVEEGLSHLKAAHWDRKVLIVISDGGDNASRHTLSQMLEDSARSNVLIYTVGFIDEHDGDQDLGVLRKIAHAAGGEAFFPTGSDEIVRMCRRIGEDIRHQYTIGYVSSNPKLDDTYRTIRVTAMKAHAGRLLVRTRAGYIATRARMGGFGRQPEHAR